MDSEQPSSESGNESAPEIQVQRRRRRRSPKTPVQRLVRFFDTWAPLLVLCGLALVAGGVVRVLETGSGGGKSSEKVIAADKVIEELEAGATESIVAVDPQEVLQAVVREEAREILDPDKESDGDALGFNSDADPLDQILDWQLVEEAEEAAEVEATELEESKFVVQDTRSLTVN
jgi:hypothetical protein